MPDMSDFDFVYLNPQHQQAIINALQLTLIEYSGMCLLSLIAIPLLGHILWVAQERKRRLPVQLQINIGVWLFYLLTALVYAAPMLYYWKGQGTDYNSFSLRVRGSINFGAMLITPISTSFVIGGRLYSLTFNTTSSRQRKKRLYLQSGSIFFLGACFALVTDAAFRRTYRNRQTTNCITFGCLLSGQLYDLIMLNIDLSLINIVFGSAFILALYKYGQNATKREKRRNHVVLMLLLAEILFNIVPALIDIVFGNIVLPFTSGNFGPILAASHTLNGFVTTMIYWIFWRTRSTNFRIQVFQTQVSSNASNNSRRRGKNQSELSSKF